eukprot:gb/GECG01013056.1/.p1 GENE.gb/GECG01013056.1/~~gb/GECG01013056.1/.p1  ORF type:complete len:219 (+),score=16.23 gb/GECG01013056.1/:1-657(+)
MRGSVGIGFVAAILATTFSCATALSLRDPSKLIQEYQNGLKIDPVPSLNVTKYLGRWYQMYDNILQNATFEKNGTCLTADYGLFSNGSVSVYNAQRDNGPHGPLNSIRGYAYQPDSSEPAKLKVVLFGGAPFPAPYWIVNLGPQNYGHENLYSYAVVSDGFQLSLFVLARDPQEFRQKYESDVLNWLNQHGFTNPLNKPYPVYQQSDCEYAPRPGFAV